MIIKNNVSNNISKQSKKNEKKSNENSEVPFNINDYVTIEKNGTPDLKIPAFLSRQERDKFIKEFASENETFKIIDADKSKWHHDIDGSEFMTGTFAIHGALEKYGGSSVVNSCKKANRKIFLTNLKLGAAGLGISGLAFAGLACVTGGIGGAVIAVAIGGMFAFSVSMCR